MLQTMTMTVTVTRKKQQNMPFALMPVRAGDSIVSVDDNRVNGEEDGKEKEEKFWRNSRNRRRK